MKATKQHYDVCSFVRKYLTVLQKEGSLMEGMMVLQCAHPLHTLLFPSSSFLFTSVSTLLTNSCVERVARRVDYGEVHWCESVTPQWSLTLYAQCIILQSSSSLVFSPKAGFGRNQSPVRRPVWLWHTVF